MPKTAAQLLAAQAAEADSKEEKFAAMVTLEALEPGGMLQDPGLIMLAAENVDGDKLAAKLEEAEKAVTSARK